MNEPVILPQGHEDRFLSKYRKQRKIRTVRMIAIPLVAMAAIAVLIRPAFQTPERIYAHYLAEVSSIWPDISENEDATETVSAITWENVPLIDQLPDELSRTEKVRILKEYYGTILHEVKSVANHLE